MMCRAALAGVLWLTSVPMPQAAIFLVNATVDQTDASPGDGVCETAPGNRVCTLRAAVQEANALTGADRIVVGAGTYVLGLPGDLENAAATGDLDITDDLAVIGAGGPAPPGAVILDGGGLDRLFHIDPAVTGVSVDLSDLTIRNGTMLQNEDIAGTVGGGAGILVRGGTARLQRVTLRDNQINNLIGAGGGIWNTGTLILEGCHLSGNRAYFAGGILNRNPGNLTIVGSTLEGNTAFGVIGSGGGVFNLGLARIVNSTLSGNTALEAHGGGISNTNVLALANVTLAGNEAVQGQGGGIFNQGALEVENTILALNTASGAANNCGSSGGTVSSFGFNIEDLDTCGLAGTGDLVSTDPSLGPLQDNGGLVPTHGLGVASPAIEGGNPGGCIDLTNFPTPLAADGRGIPRPLDGDQDGGARCDVGAYEFDRFNIWDVAAEAQPAFRLRWREMPGATGYLVYRGNVSDLPAGDYGTCQTPGGDLTVTEFQDAAVPATGEVLFYLVAARLAGQAWTIGYDGANQERILEAGTACP